MSQRSVTILFCLVVLCTGLTLLLNLSTREVTLSLHHIFSGQNNVILSVPLDSIVDATTQAPRAVTKSSDFLILPEAEQVLKARNKSRRAFFFIESSGNGKVKSRQLCAVESVARLYPKEDVYFLIVVPEGQEGRIEASEALKNVTEEFINVRVLAARLSNLLSESPLFDWVKKGKLKKSQHQVVHTSDVLRLIVLWKYGGTYLDLDIILTHPFDMPNFVVRSHAPRMVSNGVMAFQKGHEVPLKVLRYIKTNFRSGPMSFIANGPEAVTKVLSAYCGKVVAKEMNAKKCKGIEVLNPHTFYPFNYPRWRSYFTEKGYQGVLKFVNDSLGVHLWNRLSANTTIKVGSKQPYGILANMCCPGSYWNSPNKLF